MQNAPCKFSTSLVILVLGLIGTSLAADDCLEKDPNCVYICSFNVYKLGAIEAKYTSIEDETEPGDGTPTPAFAIPQRVQNLANVLAVGKFDLIVFQEVANGQPGKAVMTDLAKELHDKFHLNYTFFLSDYIGQG